MDMFYGATEGVVKHQRRFHFHEVTAYWYRVWCNFTMPSSEFYYVNYFPKQLLCNSTWKNLSYKFLLLSVHLPVSTLLAFIWFIISCFFLVSPCQCWMGICKPCYIFFDFWHVFLLTVRHLVREPQAFHKMINHKQKTCRV